MMISLRMKQEGVSQVKLTISQMIEAIRGVKRQCDTFTMKEAIRGVTSQDNNITND